MILSNIKTETTWNDAASSINSNTQRIGNEIDKLGNATYKNKGYFPTVETLQSAFPTSNSGSRAYVGYSYPYAIYLWDTSTLSWVDSGTTGGDETVALGDYYTKEECSALLSDYCTKEEAEEFIDLYHVVLSESEYEELALKEEKMYFCYEDEEEEN